MENKNLKIITIENKNDAKFLRKKTAHFDFKTHSTSSGQALDKKELAELIKSMRQIMREANGIGLSANQIGLDMRLFVAQLPSPQKYVEQTQNYAEGLRKSASNLRGSAPEKFYAVFNPEITKFSDKKSEMEEGCLSVPGFYGIVERPEKITLEGQDKNGRKIKIKAAGMLARVFQHETDHLNGVLFIDRTKKIHKVESIK